MDHTLSNLRYKLAQPTDVHFEPFLSSSSLSRDGPSARTLLCMQPITLLALELHYASQQVSADITAQNCFLGVEAF